MNTDSVTRAAPGRPPVEDGVVCAIRYGVVHDDPSTDAHLEAIVAAVGTELVVSGIGALPAVVHAGDVELAGSTSGSMCVAPTVSMALLLALHEGRFDDAEDLRELVLPQEDLRDGFGRAHPEVACGRARGWHRRYGPGPFPPVPGDRRRATADRRSGQRAPARGARTRSHGSARKEIA